MIEIEDGSLLVDIIGVDDNLFDGLTPNEVSTIDAGNQYLLDLIFGFHTQL